jgi:flagellar M-ring protein FliF
MDFAKAQYERIRQQLNGLSASQRMLTMSLLVIMGIVLLYWVKYAGKPEMEALLDQPMAAEDVARIREKLVAHGWEYQLSGDRLLVEAEKKQEILAVLYYDQALPSNTSAAWDAIVNKINPWNSEAQNAQWWLQAKQAKLAEVIRGFPGVADATVMIDTTEHRGFGGNSVRPSATINIKTREGKRGDKKLVMAAADMVGGAQAGLDRGRIHVIINGVSFPMDDQSEDSMGGADELLEVRQQNEGYYIDKIKKQLGWLNADVFVSVAVDINTKATQEQSTIYDPKGTAKVETEIRSSGTDEDNDSKAAGEPGVGANTQGSLADGSGGGGKETRNQTEDETHFQAGLSKKDLTSTERPGAAKVLSATVRVPRSYFVKLYKDRNPNAKEPDEATLQPYIDGELTKIKSDVRLCTALADDKSVAVETYADTMVLASAGDATPLAVTPTGVTMMVGGHGKEIALGVLAVISLFMMSSMVKKGAPVPVMASEPEPEGPAVQLAGGEEVVGEAGDGETILGGMELDEDSAKTQQMLGQVSDLVKENPDAAANLIKRWMNK